MQPLAFSHRTVDNKSTTSIGEYVGSIGTFGCFVNMGSARKRIVLATEFGLNNSDFRGLA